MYAAKMSRLAEGTEAAAAARGLEPARAPKDRRAFRFLRRWDRSRERLGRRAHRASRSVRMPPSPLRNRRRRSTAAHRPRCDRRRRNRPDPTKMQTAAFPPAARSRASSPRRATARTEARTPAASSFSRSPCQLRRQVVAQRRLILDVVRRQRLGDDRNRTQLGSSSSRLREFHDQLCHPRAVPEPLHRSRWQCLHLPRRASLWPPEYGSVVQSRVASPVAISVVLAKRRHIGEFS